VKVFVRHEKCVSGGYGKIHMMRVKLNLECPGGLVLLWSSTWKKGKRHTKYDMCTATEVFESSESG
jgi:hypothetical protein